MGTHMYLSLSVYQMTYLWPVDGSDSNDEPPAPVQKKAKSKLVITRSLQRFHCCILHVSVCPHRKDKEKRTEKETAAKGRVLVLYVYA